MSQYVTLILYLKLTFAKLMVIKKLKFEIAYLAILNQILLLNKRSNKNKRKDCKINLNVYLVKIS